MGEMAATFLKKARRLDLLPQPARPFRPCLDVLEDRLAPATFRVPANRATVTTALADVGRSPDKANTIALAAGVFQAANVKITVAAGKSLTIVGQGADRTFISANQANRVFEVVSGKVPFQDLTITGGNVVGQGGGLLISAGTVTLHEVVVANNVARGANGAAGSVGDDGFGIPGQRGQDAKGGGIYLSSGSLTLYQCTIAGNTARGGQGGDGITSAAPAVLPGPAAAGDGGDAYGGGLYVNGGTVVGERLYLTNNLAQGGDGGTGADDFSGDGGDAGAARGGGYYARNSTLNGARVGDVFMSLIYTCQLNDVNPFDYLTELQRHADQVAADPDRWLPWNYRAELTAQPSTPTT
jgi:hypothetical protein